MQALTGRHWTMQHLICKCRRRKSEKKCNAGATAQAGDQEGCKGYGRGAWGHPDRGHICQRAHGHLREGVYTMCCLACIHVTTLRHIGLYVQGSPLCATGYQLLHPYALYPKVSIYSCQHSYCVAQHCGVTGCMDLPCCPHVCHHV